MEIEDERRHFGVVAHSSFVQGAVLGVTRRGHGDRPSHGSTQDDGLGSVPGLADLEDRRLFSSISGSLFGRERTVSIGRYVLEGRLGAGAMGEVFLGRDPELDRHVAIKLVHAHLADERYAARLRREAKALARLAHPNAVRVYEVGEHEGRVFLAMEHVRGGSLRSWIADERPAWPQVLDAYVRAGRGLAAAHRAGLTHRDFKPDNVLRGDDGRILVADFGLASLGGRGPGSRTDASPSDPAMAMEGVLSEAGEIKGTPAYMPPEQFDGATLDGRADQFAFCVSLYEGLWGRRPFPEDSLRARLAAVARGPAAPRELAGVPDWVWPVLQRGLAHDAERRWPSMDALLDALEAIPRRRRRRRGRVVLGLSLGLTAGAAAIAGATWWSRTEPGGNTCEALGSELAGIWDRSRRDEVGRALLATEHPLAAETWDRVARDLDGWTARSLAEQTASCRATRIEGTQSEAMLDRRSVCLQRQRGEVRALVDALAAADREVVARAGQVLAQLPDLGACGVEALEAGAAPELAPAVQDEVDAGYRALAGAQAELSVGHRDRAVALADEARQRGEATDHAPLSLAARAMQAEITMRSGDLEPGLAVLREVVLAAERAELHELVADLRVQLARSAAGDSAQPELERWLIDEAQVAVDRVARPDDPREVTLQSARARIAEQAGDFPAAIAAHQRAHALAQGRLDEGERALLRVGVGTAKYRNGDYEGARTELRQALEVVRATWGPRAPEAARIEFDLGMIATDLGAIQEAEQHLAAAMAIDEATWGPESIEVARDRFAGAYLAFGTGDIERGCRSIAEVLAVYRAKLGPTHDETAAAVNANAGCLHHAGDYEGAIVGYEQALAVQRRLLGEAHHEVGLLHANLGMAQLRLGRFEEALASNERALEILSATLPADHPELAEPLAGRALVWVETGKAAEAIADLERALALQSEASAPSESRFGLARALVAVHGRREWARARALAQQALDDFERGGIESRAEAVRRWLAAQPD